MEAHSRRVAAVLQTFPELWDFYWEQRSWAEKHKHDSLLCFACLLLLIMWIHITVIIESWPDVALEPGWNHMSAHSNMWVSINQMKTGMVAAEEDGGASQMFWQECGLCLFMVFIHWYLLWDRHDDTVACHRGRWRCYVWSIWPRIWEGLNSWELSVMRWREGLPQIQDPTPGSEVPVVRKPYLMMDDGGCMRRNGMYWKKTELNLMGWGFVRISGEYVKGCLHSWTHPMPRLHKKLRHLASTRRTSLGFWRQEVDHLILCKLQSWLWEKISRSLVCYKNKIWKLRVLR